MLVHGLHVIFCLGPKQNLELPLVNCETVQVTSTHLTLLYRMHFLRLRVGFQQLERRITPPHG